MKSKKKSKSRFTLVLGMHGYTKGVQVVQNTRIQVATFTLVLGMYGRTKGVQVVQNARIQVATLYLVYGVLCGGFPGSTLICIATVPRYAGGMAQS